MCFQEKNLTSNKTIPRVLQVKQVVNIICRNYFSFFSFYLFYSLICSFVHSFILYTAVSLWRRHDRMGQEGKWARGRAEACPTESARARRLRTGYCTQQIGDFRSMRNSPVPRQPYSTLLPEYWSSLQCISKLPMSIGLRFL